LGCLVDDGLFDLLLLFCPLDADCPEMCPFAATPLFLEDLALIFWFFENFSLTTCSLLLLVDRDGRDWLEVPGSAGGADGVLRPRCKWGMCGMCRWGCGIYIKIL